MKTTAAVVRPMERLLRVSGWLAAREQATLSVKVAGRLKRIEVDLGSKVQVGDTLAQVEPRDYELRLQQSKAALAQARAGLGLSLEGDDDQVDPERTTLMQQAKAVFDEVTRNRERILTLAKAGVSSQSEVDTVESSFKVARERYAAAREEVAIRQATLALRRAEFDLAKQQLSDTAVRAPFTGTINSRLAQLGEYLPAGSPVVSLVQTDPLRLRLEIPERESAQVRSGQSIRLQAEGDSRTYEGSIARLSAALTEASRMLVVEADVPNPGGLRPGLFVRADIVVDANDRGLAVPASALIVFAGLEKVVSVHEGKAVEKPVTTGRRADAWVEVVTGLKPEDRIIVEPGGLRTGAPVVVEDSPAASSPR